MKEKKININRAKVTSAEIEEKRNFDQLVLQLKTPPNPFYSSIGFWGKTGMAGLVILFVVKSITSLFNNNINENAYDEKITSTETITELPEDTRCLTPVSKENDIPFTYHQVVCGESAELTLEDGSIIHIPENAFIADAGAIVSLSIRLFNDKTSAFLAGVPMDYQESAFESAGMLEIRGEINGKVATINPDAPISIHLNMYKHPDGFDFFALDDHSGDWKLYPADFSTALNLPVNPSNDDVDLLREELENIQLTQKKVRNELGKLSMPSEKDHYIPKHEQLQFQLDFDNSLFPELASFKTLLFEALPNQYNYSKVVKTTWSDFEIIKDKGEFIALFKKAGQKEMLKVRPVVSGIELEKALRDYEAAKKVYFTEQTKLSSELEELKRKEEEKSARIKMLANQEKQAELLSIDKSTDAAVLQRQKNAVSSKLMTATASFKTTKWGVFNADRPVNYPAKLNVPLNLIAENHNRDDVDKAFVFDMKKDVRYTFGSFSHTMDHFGINNNNTVIMILYKNGDIGYAETTRKELEENEGKLELTPVSADEINEEKIKTILHEGRFSA